MHLNITALSTRNMPCKAMGWFSLSRRSKSWFKVVCVVKYSEVNAGTSAVLTYCEQTGGPLRDVYAPIVVVTQQLAPSQWAA